MGEHITKIYFRSHAALFLQEEEPVEYFFVTYYKPQVTELKQAQYTKILSLFSTSERLKFYLKIFNSIAQIWM